MRIDSQFKNLFDARLFFAVFCLVILGLLAIYSSTQNTVYEKGNFSKQLFSFGVSLIAFFIVYTLPQKTIETFTNVSFLATTLLLILVLIIGKKIGGAKGWIQMGGFSVQPSEFAKVTMILLLAKIMSSEKFDINRIKNLAIISVIWIVPVILILLEPDLGSIFVFAGIFIVMIFVGGISLFGLFAVLSPGFVAIASLFGKEAFFVAMLIVLVMLVLLKRNLLLSGSAFTANLAAGLFVDSLTKILSPHQQKRIASFLQPDLDPLGSGYNALQAKIAIGSGGFWGKGFLNGNQTQLQFIPEQWTDFIFCVIGEEFGFIGSVFLIVLYAIVFYRLIKMFSHAKDKFMELVLSGILAVYFVHFTVNLGMAIGILPVIGIPLPFVSYGGTSLIANMMLLGLAFNVYRTRRLHA